MAHSPEAAERSRSLPAPEPRTCAVCTSGDVQIDHVRHGGWLEIGECGHCGHRWTAQAAPVPRRERTVVAGSDRLSEVAQAA